jgi:hypothetical protein
MPNGSWATEELPRVLEPAWFAHQVTAMTRMMGCAHDPRDHDPGVSLSP